MHLFLPLSLDLDWPARLKFQKTAPTSAVCENLPATSQPFSHASVSWSCWVLVDAFVAALRQFPHAAGSSTYESLPVGCSRWFWKKSVAWDLVWPVMWDLESSESHGASNNKWHMTSAPNNLLRSCNTLRRKDESSPSALWGPHMTAEQWHSTLVADMLLLVSNQRSSKDCVWFSCLDHNCCSFGFIARLWSSCILQGTKCFIFHLMFPYFLLAP